MKTMAIPKPFPSLWKSGVAFIFLGIVSILSTAAPINAAPAGGSTYASVFPTGNINTGNPTHPFGQYLDPPYGKKAVPAGVTDADMDVIVRQIYDMYINSVPTYTGDAIAGVNLIAPYRFNDSTSVVSEGMGYGMLIAAEMADKTLFDGYALYFWNHMRKAANGCAGTYNDNLASWEMSGTPPYTAVTGCDSATDGDEDMAMGCLMACKQWPGTDHAC
jgi:hypothetical protein